MEHYKIYKLLNDRNLSKFEKRKWYEVNDLSGGHYSVNNNISIKAIVMHILLWKGKCLLKMVIMVTEEIQS